ncbi:MAG: hydrogenase expression/formation C-terminal domain-containing protein [Candidatus Thiodiazotropha sp.]
MQRLQDIAVTVASSDDAPLNHANAIPILHEVLHALNRFAQQGSETTIDLRAIPFGPGDEQALLDILGRGEVEVMLRSLGDSTIWESSYPGVWVVDHRNAENERVALQLVIGRIPEIIQSQTEDILDAVDRLQERLEVYD